MNRIIKEAYQMLVAKGKIPKNWGELPQNIMLNMIKHEILIDYKRMEIFKRAMREGFDRLSDLNYDKAREINDMGWNKPDTYWAIDMGHPSSWDEDDYCEVLDHLNTYKNTQLADLFRNMIPPPETALYKIRKQIEQVRTEGEKETQKIRRGKKLKIKENRKGRKITYEQTPDGEYFSIWYDYDEDINSVIRGLGGRFTGTDDVDDAKRYRFKKTQAKQVFQLISNKELGFDFEDEATRQKAIEGVLEQERTETVEESQERERREKASKNKYITVDKGQKWEESLVFYFEKDFNLKDRLKEMARGAGTFAWFNSAKLRWEVPLKIWDSVKEFAQEEGFFVDEAVYTRMNEKKEDAKRIDAKKEESYQLSTAASSTFYPPKLQEMPVTFRPYQLAGVEYMVKHPATLQADDPGLGKTLQTLAAIYYLDAFPVLMVCPASLQQNWWDEIKKFYPSNVKKRVHIIESREEKYEDWIDDNGNPPDFLFTHYKNLHYLKDEIIKFKAIKTIVYDESHNLANYNTAQSKAALEIVKEINPPYRYLITATPTRNFTKDLIHQLEILGTIASFGGFWRFAVRYCDAHKKKIRIKGGYVREVTEMDGAQNLQELWEKMRETGFIKRSIAVVAPDLPSKNRIPYNIILSNNKQYQKLKDKFLNEYEQHLQEKIGEGKSQLLREIKKSGLSYEAYIADRVQSFEEGNRGQQLFTMIQNLDTLGALGKVDFVKQMIDDFYDEQRKCVFFGTHIEALTKLAKYAGKKQKRDFELCMINGGQDTTLRGKIHREYNQDKDFLFIFVNIVAGREGLNLQSSQDLAFIEYPYTGTDIEQCEGRIRRIGSEKFDVVNYHYIVGADTFDLYRLKLIAAKWAKTSIANKGQDEAKKDIFYLNLGDVVIDSSENVTDEMIGKSTRAVNPRYKNPLDVLGNQFFGVMLNGVSFIAI